MCQLGAKNEFERLLGGAFGLTNLHFDVSWISGLATLYRLIGYADTDNASLMRLALVGFFALFAKSVAAGNVGFRCLLAIHSVAANLPPWTRT